MKNFLRTLITGTYDSIKELPPVPDIPVFFPDAIYRVCNAPPDSLCTISHIATGVVHIFPWNPSLIVGKSAVTYGLLSKVQSPKEAKEKIKRALEKKNSVPKEQPLSDKRGEDKKREEAMVVRTICHGTEMLTSRERCPSKGEIYCGKVWVSMKILYSLVLNSKDTFCSFDKVYVFSDPRTSDERNKHPTSLSCSNKACQIHHKSSHQTTPAASKCHCESCDQICSKKQQI